MRREDPVTRVMTECVVVIEADRPVSEALACFAQYRFHHLPVVRDGRIAGMLSSADVLKLEHFRPRGQDALYLDERFRIEQIMRTPVVHVGPQASVGEVADILIESGVHAVPVVDADGRLVGLVTSSDLIQSLLHGPPPRAAGATLARAASASQGEETGAEPIVHLKPADGEFAVALATAETLHVEDRDPRFLGKTLLYLAQRRVFLEKVAAMADRFLRAGQDELNHALLLKSILAAKRVEERATLQARVPFPLA